MSYIKQNFKNYWLKNVGFKHLNIATFIILLTVLVFLSGCLKVSPDIVKHPLVSFHDKYADILKSCVDNRGMVNYKMLKRKRPELNQILNDFAKIDPEEYNSWSEEDKIAFWLNAYNVKLLKTIVDNYPIQSQRILRVLWGPDSIRHIDGIWDKYKFTVMDEEFTLKEVEQRFLREKFKEPRVFLAISQASLSGPPLRNEPYYGSNLYEQLDDQTKKFLSNRSAFRIDRQGKTVYLSSIFDPTWYGNEFIGKYATDKKFKDQSPSVRAVLSFISNYISEQDLLFLERENYLVKYIKYNWTVNDSSVQR
ncbi:MAG: DUF547 domain-containing protein [Sedimentisphaerales bacterium]|nr:DUF547 domain-containing protein [Sedimentisphaerales bacterium]